MFAELALDLLLAIAFGTIAWLSFRTAADPNRAASVAAGLASKIEGAPNFLKANSWAHSPTALRWYGFTIGLASLNFLLLAVHLLPLVYLSVACFLVAPIIAGVSSERYRIRREGIRAITKPRGWEVLAWLLIFGYTVGVLMLGKALLLS